MVSGSNTTMSASLPSLIRPLRRIAGTRSCSSTAGCRLHLARISDSDSPPLLRSVLIERAYVPAVLGCVSAAGGSGQASGSGGVPIQVRGIASLAITEPGKVR
jgi:hypothetical protein